MNSGFPKFSLNPSYQNNFNTARHYSNDDLHDNFNLKINNEKRKEDRNLYIPNSPDLKSLLGKSVTKKKADSLTRSQMYETTKYTAINLQTRQCIQDKSMITFNTITHSQIDLTEKDPIINLRTDDIFSTSNTFNSLDENLDDKFQRTTEDVSRLLFILSL
jgi:hypothetical protein